MRRINSAAAAAVAVLLLFLTAGCANKVLDRKKTEKAVTASLEAGGAGQIKSLKCPSNVKVEKGKTFSCSGQSATGQKFTVTLRMTDNNGRMKPAGLS